MEKPPGEPHVSEVADGGKAAAAGRFVKVTDAKPATSPKKDIEGITPDGAGKADDVEEDTLSEFAKASADMAMEDDKLFSQLFQHP